MSALTFPESASVVGKAVVHRDDGWATLYRIGGAAAAAVLALAFVQIVVFVVWPLPTKTEEWLALFQNNAVVGLLSMDLLLIVDWILMALMYLALYVALRHVSPSLMAIGLVLELVAVAAYMASTTAFEMLSLTGAYATAATAAERSALLAVGSALVASWEGTAFSVSYVLSAVAALIVSAVMLRGAVFSRPTAYAGLLMGAASLVPPTVGAIGVTLSVISLLPMWVWLFLVARRLVALGNGER